MFANTKARLDTGRPVTVVYYGGSITLAGFLPGLESRSMGYRDYITEAICKKYPQANVTAICSAVPGTGSELGALRMETELLPYHPDLVFVEYAVNDGGEATGNIVRNMESIVRQLWKQNPMTDIAFVYTLGKGMFNMYAREKLPASIEAQEKVAKHYGIPSLNFGTEFFERYRQDDLVWKDYFLDDVHPTPAGHAVYGAAAVKTFIDSMGGDPIPHIMPPPIGKPSLTETHVIAAADIFHEGWETMEKSYLDRLQVWVCADKPGMELSFHFTGNILGVSWNVATDTGDAEYSVDGGEWQRSPTWDCYVEEYPDRVNYKIWADDLPDGEHTVRIRITKNSVWKQAQGTALRFISFHTGRYGEKIRCRHFEKNE